ncbi:hypothetical protein FXV77_18030 [Sphingobacterium phlebotomi]|uniref:Uncharacterized protein n=1 Tax=Sphingobacterium phlebotomi TaxID=2605433 RepID=A0A5D4GYU0_9SPHI|nr:hypothetical protein [Sphingobacterium phlebotomi]TYR33354.1 hypothetical protein FXV77_18030 [Sphingobacterium phlebotomi]
MKRTLWVIIVAVLVVGIALLTLYIVRKNRSLDQYVHPNSYAIVSVSLDDLLLDNLDQLFKSRTSDTVEENFPLLDLENWWKAGIEIPAQIHFFSLHDDPLTFFTIQRIDNLGKWKTFLKEYVTDSLYTIDDPQRLTLAHFPSLTSTLYNEQYALFRIGLSKHDRSEEMKAIWSEEKDWVHVRDLHQHVDKRTNTHVAYYHTDRTFQLFADISKNQIALSGQWQLASALPASTQVRQPTENTNLFLSFWSTLPLAQMPFITKFLTVFSDIDEANLIDNSYGYTDLFINNSMTTQRDTIVVYDYDEDFNSVERKEIQETRVPVMENVWKGNDQLAALLPNKLFYNFNKTLTDSLILLSTNEQVEFSPNFVTASSPFHFLVDFSNIPNAWNGPIFRSLQRRDVKVNVTTSVSDRHTLGIEGNISYNAK